MNNLEYRIEETEKIDGGAYDLIVIDKNEPIGSYQNALWVATFRDKSDAEAFKGACERYKGITKDEHLYGINPITGESERVD